MKNETKILLFTSAHSLHYHLTMEEFDLLQKTLEKTLKVQYVIIDIAENPELAEKYKIEALPTLIVGDKRFAGIPKSQDVMDAIAMV